MHILYAVTLHYTHTNCFYRNPCGGCQIICVLMTYYIVNHARRSVCSYKNDPYIICVQQTTTVMNIKIDK